MDNLTPREARLMREISQEEMARRIGVSRSTYIKLEEHPENMTIMQGTKFADAVNIAFDNIIFLPICST